MKVSRRVGVTAIALATMLLLIHCTEKNYTINQLPTDSVHIRGTVYAWRCGVGDWFNNPLDPELSRFSVNTGEAATVTFIRDNGFTSIVETDDSSDFSLHLSAGSHKVVVETGYTFPPDTFYNVQLEPGDTTLEYHVVYRVLDPLNIVFVFSYSSIDDTTGMVAEWDVIKAVNRCTFQFGEGLPLLDILDVVSPVSFHHLSVSEFTPRVYSNYAVPVYREHPGYGEPHNVWEAFELIQGLLDADTTGLAPSNMSIYPAGGYICLAHALALGDGPGSASVHRELLTY